MGELDELLTDSAMPDMVRFKEGQTVWKIPIRYWEPEYPIVPMKVLATCGMDATTVYAKEDIEDYPGYYGCPDRVFFNKDHAEAVRKLLCQIRDIGSEDGGECLCSIVMENIRQRKEWENATPGIQKDIQGMRL